MSTTKLLYMLIIFCYYTEVLGHTISNPNLCSRYCKESKNEHGYKVGSMYIYEYTGSVNTLIRRNEKDNATHNQQTATFSATVEMFSLSPCDFEIQVKSVDTINGRPGNDYERLLTKYPVKFSFENGKIESVCAHVGDSKAILNIKRGIISAFQNSIQNLDTEDTVYETDVSGTCETQYEVLESNSKIRKTKDLINCNKRTKRYHSWQSEVYNKNQAKFSSPLLKSTQTCIQTYQENILISAECDEDHMFRPFSNGENGVVTLLHQKLQHLKTTRDKPTLHNHEFKHTTLLYEEDKKVIKEKFNLIRIIRVMDELVMKTKDGIEMDAPERFSELLNLIEGADKASMLRLFEKIKQFKQKKKFFVDTVSLTSSVDSVEVMKTLYDEKEITIDLFNNWISSLAFVKDPSREFLLSLSVLMDIGHPIKQKIHLSISSLIYQYCKTNQKCEDDEELIKLFKHIAKPIQFTCSPTFSFQDDIILSLKSIGNSGQSYFGKYLKQCYMSHFVSNEIKIVAIQAHRRMNCDKSKNVEDLEKLFSNKTQTSEIRITSYLALMECSSYSIFEMVMDVLNNEETNQVSSFIFSHLSNLQETSIFWKRDLKRLMESELLKDKFNTDRRKYSRNYEAAAFLNAIDTGIGVESNIIFTKESYLPKSATLNFTLDLFGENINLFEFGGRMEGFENIIENIFGPRGYFPEKSIKSFLENQRNDHSMAMSRISEDFQSFNAKTKDPSGMIYAKVFGNEVSYARFKNIENILGKPTSIKSILNAALDFFKNSELEYTKFLKFLDTSYKIPTLLGFPLEISVNGTATLGLTVKGKVVTKEFKNLKFNVEGKIYPSASVQVIGKIGLDAYFTKTELKSINTLHSNTYIDGHVNIDKGKLVDLKVNTPKRRMDIINMTSDVFYIKDNVNTKVDDLSTDGENRVVCTEEYFKNLTGLEICHHLKYVNASAMIHAPYFPLTGSSKYSISIKKVDTFDSYQLKWLSKFVSNKNLYQTILYIDTPNSQVNRKLNASFLLDAEEKIFDVRMTSPFISFDLLGKAQFEPSKFAASLKHVFNNKEIIHLETTLSSLARKLDLEIIFNFKGNEIVSLKGSITPTSNVATSELMIRLIQKYFVIINSTLKIKNGEYSLHSNVIDGFTNRSKGTLESQFVQTSHSLAFTAKCIYEAGAKIHEISMDFNASRDNKFDVNRHILYLNLNSTQKPEYNVFVDLESYRANLHYDLKGVINIFDRKWETRQLLKYIKHTNFTDITLISSISCPKRDIDYRVILSYNSSNVKRSIHGLVQLNRTQRLEVQYYNKLIQHDTDIKFYFYYPNNSYSVRGEIKKDDIQKFKVKFIGEKEIQDSKEVFFEIDGFYINSTKDKLQNYSLAGKIDVSKDIKFLQMPWTFRISIQKATDIFSSMTEIQSKNNTLASQILRTEHVLNTNLKWNEKKVFFLNGKWKLHQIEFKTGIDIYQNFELDVLFQPYTKIDLNFLWDKYKNPNHKISLNLENCGGGLFTMALQYPNQKVIVSFTLQSTQITLNITWGFEFYQKIYLNVGSKVYDIGGTWYGELQTPFKYFESQNFNIEYVIMRDSLNVEIRVFWRDHRIDFGILGSRSATHINGKLDIMTSLSEIFKVGVGVSHYENTNSQILEKYTNVSLVYNQHEIIANNKWTKEGLNINSRFEVTSPSNTITAILATLEVKNNESTSHMNSILSWQDKEMSVNYKVENSRSLIVIRTPFKGIEKTKLRYSLIRTMEDLRIEIEIDVLNQLNYIFLQCSNDNLNIYKTHFEITSPMTGTYQLIFEHSTEQGYLMENLTVNHGKDNNTILGIEVVGNFVSIWDIDLKLSVIFLEHNAICKLENSIRPLSSKIEAKWDKISIASTFEVDFAPEKLSRFLWLVNSSIFADEFQLQYKTIYNKHSVSLHIPTGCGIENTLNLEYPRHISNTFVFTTPESFGEVLLEHNFEKDTYDDRIKIKLNHEIVTCDLKVKTDEDIFVEFAKINVETTWKDQFIFDYQTKKNISIASVYVEPIFYMNYNNKILEIKTMFSGTNLKIESSIHVNGTELSPINIVGNFNRKEKYLFIDIISENIEGHISSSMPNILLVNIKSKVSIDLQGLLNLIKPRLIRSSETKLLLKIHMDDQRPFELYFKSEIENWENLHIRLEKTNCCQNGTVAIRRNEESLYINYHIKELSYFIANFNVNINSNIEFLNNSKLHIYVDPLDKKLTLKVQINKHELELIYLLDFHDFRTSNIKVYERDLKVKFLLKNEMVQFFNLFLDVKTKFSKEKENSSFFLAVDSNKSKLNVTLSKTKWDKLVLKIFSKPDDVNYASTNFNFTKSDKNLYLFCDTESSYGNLYLKAEVTEDLNFKNVISHIEYKNDEFIYLAKISTKYYNILWIDSKLELNTPNKFYSGNLRLQFGEQSNILLAFTNTQEKNNKIEIVLNIHNIKKVNGFFDSRIDIFETETNKLTFDYDLESEIKKFALTYHSDLQKSDLIKMDVKLNTSYVHIIFDLPSHNLLFNLKGRNILQSNEISLLYDVNYNSHVIRIDYFYTNKSFTQIKLEISSNIKNWERIILEKKIDDSKIRIFFYSKYHTITLLADKTAIHQEKDLLVFEYNNEPLIVIRRGKDQNYLMTSSKYVDYKLIVQYVSDPRIYAFSILKNGDNLMSFMLHNTSDLNNFQFKGKFFAPILFPNYPELTFTLNSDPQISKSLHFTLWSKNKNIFEIKWSSKIETTCYEAYFKYSSEISLLTLKNFEIHPYVDISNDFVFKFVFTQDNSVSYLTELIIPVKNLDTKFNIEFPCQSYQCNYYFYLNRTFVDVHWSLPLEIARKIKLKLDLNKFNTFGNFIVDLNFERDDDKLLSGCSINFNEKRHFGFAYLNFDIDNVTSDQEVYYTYTPSKEIEFKLMRNDLNVAFNLLQQTNKVFNINLEGKENKILIDGILSQNTLNISLSNGFVLTTINIIKYANSTDNTIYLNIEGQRIYQNISKRKYENAVFSKIMSITQLLTRYLLNNKIQSEFYYSESSPNFDFNTTIIGYNNHSYNLLYRKCDLGGEILLVAESGQLRIFYEVNDEMSHCGAETLEEKFIYMKYLMRSDHIDHQFVITNIFEVNIDSYVKYRKNINNINISASIPISRKDHVTYDLNLTKFDNEHILENRIKLSEKRTISISAKASFLETSNYVEVHVIPSYMDEFHSSLLYDNTDNINLTISSYLGNNSIGVTCSIVSKRKFSVILKTPYKGYTYTSLEAKFDKETKNVYLKMSKEEFYLVFESLIKQLSDSTHELNVEVNTSIPNIFLVIGKIKLDTAVMTLNAYLNVNTKKILFSVSYDPSDLKLILESPFEEIKHLRLSGVYLNSDNSYNLEGDGYWDNTTMKLFGNLNLKPDNFKFNSEIIIDSLHQGKIELTIQKHRNFTFYGYYPEPASNVYLILQLNSDGSNFAKRELSLKTPFANFKNMFVVFIESLNAIEAKTSMNVMNQEIVSEVVVPRVNSGIKIITSVLFPETKTKYSSELFLDLYKSSYLKLNGFFIQYDVENKFLFKLISGIKTPIVLEILHQNSKGEIRAKHLKSHLQMNYIIFDELNYILEYRTFRDSFSISRNILHFIRKEFNDVYSELKFVNNLEIFEFILMETSYDLISKVILDKNITKLDIEYHKTFKLHYDKSDERCQFNLKFKDYLITNFMSTESLINFDVASPNSDAMIIVESLDRNRFFGNTVFQFKRFNEVMILFNALQDYEHVNIKCIIKKELDLELKYEYNTSEFYISIENENHKISYEFSELNKIKFLFNSPVLLNDGYLITLKTFTTFKNFTFSITCPKGKNIYLTLTANIDMDFISVDFLAPQYEILSLIRFETAWGNKIFKTLNSVQVISSKLGNVSVVGNLDLTAESLDIAAHLKLPFLENFKKLDAEFHIHKNTTPWFYVKLPNNKIYSLNTVYVNDDKTFHIDLEYVCTKSVYGVNLTYSKDNTLFSAEARSPHQGYEHFAFAVQNINNIHIALLDVNERVYDINITYAFEDESQWLNASLHTSLENNEDYHFEIGHGSTFFRCFLFYPNLKRPVGFSFNNQNFFDIKYKISLPQPVNGFEYNSFEVKLLKYDNLVNISAICTLNDRFINLYFNINDNRNVAYLTAALETNADSVSFKMNSIYDNYMKHNDKYIYNIIFDGTLYAYVDLYFRKFLLKIDFISIPNFEVKLWNPNDPNYKYGCDFNFDKQFNTTSIGLYLPQKSIIVNQQYYSNSTNNIFLAKVTHNNDSIGLKINFFKFDCSEFMEVITNVDLELPFREFQVEHDLKLYTIGQESVKALNRMRIRWDKSIDSEIRWKVLLGDRNLESSLSSNILDHDIVLKIESSKLNAIPYGLALEIKYSPLIEKLIHMEMVYNKTDVNNVTIDERKWILSHPYSHLNHTMITKVVRNNKYTNITVLLEYTDFVINKPDFTKASVEIGHDEFLIAGLIDTKKNTLFIYSKSSTDVYSKGLEIMFKMNDKEPLLIDYFYTFKETSPFFKLNMGYGDDRNYNFYVGIPTKKEITAKLIHNIHGNEYTDGLLTIKLNTTSLLWIKMLWKTGLLSQFHKTIIDEYRDMKFVVQAAGTQLIDCVNDDTGRLLLTEYKTMRGKLNNSLYEESKKVFDDFNLFYSNVQKSCLNNTFYCKDFTNLRTSWFGYTFKNRTQPFANIISNFSSNLMKIASRACNTIELATNEIEEAINKIEDLKTFKENAKTMLHNSLDEAKKSIKNMKQTALNLFDDFVDYLHVIKKEGEDFFRPAINLVNEFWAYFENQLTYLQILIFGTMDTIQNYVLNLQETKQMLKIYNNAISWVDSINFFDILNPIWNIAENILDAIIDDIKIICDDFLPYQNTIKELIFGKYNQLLTYTQIDKIKELVNEVSQKVIWFWKYHNFTENMRSYAMEKGSLFINMLVTNLFGITEDGLGIFDYTSETGLLEISQRLPVEWESFDKSPAFEQHPLYNHIFKKISSLIVNRVDIFLTKFKIIIYSLLNINVSPPTDNFAMVVGNNHFVTFNNKHFDFKGDCSYILVSDFDTQTFSILINYNQYQEKRSLTIISYQNNATIDILDDSPIIFNSEIVDLPICMENLCIHREEDSIIIDNFDGIMITCNYYYDYCEIKVSEWLFGKIGGLLGTMDNEASTDMRAPDGTIPKTTQSLANSWKVGKCKLIRQVNSDRKIKRPKYIHTVINSVCTEVFLISNSSLSSCFPIIDSRPFYEMCIKDTNGNLCSSIAAYRANCKNKHVWVKMPDFCISCNLSTNIGSNEKIFEGHSLKTIDVIFIQELGCLSNISHHLPNQLNQALIKKEFINNKFAFVTYGGEHFAKPALNTINGSIWTNGASNVSIPKIMNRSGTTMYTVEHAVKYAAQLEFRPAVTKMFVLIICEVCEEMTNSLELYNMLGEKDIILHIIKPDPFGSLPILAIDSTSTQLDNKGTLRTYVSNEEIMDGLRDMYSELALSTSGSVAKSEIIEDQNIAHKWIDLVTNTARTSSCQKCKCVQNRNGVGRVDCNRCMSPLVKHLLNEYEQQHLRQ